MKNDSGSNSDLRKRNREKRRRSNDAIRDGKKMNIDVPLADLIESDITRARTSAMLSSEKRCKRKESHTMEKIMSEPLALALVSLNRKGKGKGKEGKASSSSSSKTRKSTSTRNGEENRGTIPKIRTNTSTSTHREDTQYRKTQPLSAKANASKKSEKEKGTPSVVVALSALAMLGAYNSDDDDD